MADVKIVDIDNEQWNMKDQEARTRIATLEEKTTVTTERLHTSANSFINKVTINGENFLQVHFDDYRYQGQAVMELFQISETIGNTSILRCQVMGDLHSDIDRISMDIDISPDGRVSAVILNQRVYSGGTFDISLYGDGFIKIF